MTIEEAIKHAEEVANEQERLMGRYDAASGYARSGNESIRTESAKECEKCAAEHKQFAAWLRELQETRKERDYWQEKANSYEQTIFKLTDSISKQPEIVRCGECRHRDPEDKKCDCGHGVIWQLPRGDDWYCADAERRTE